MRIVLILVDGMRPDSFQDLEKARQLPGRREYQGYRAHGGEASGRRAG